MTCSFQIAGLDHDWFAPLFALSDEELKQRGAVRRIANESPGFPCRVSLEDAAVGEELLLLPYVHQGAASPYRASGPIFVRRGVRRASLPEGVVPSYVSRRLISIRAYDHDDMLIRADVTEGAAVADSLEAFFEAEEVRYIHLHNARQGCFSCRVDRATRMAS